MVEPAGAATVAALLQYPGAFEPPVVAVLSGGNVDPVLLLQIIQHGMTAGGRYLRLHLRVPDRPGSLVGRAHPASSGLGANVLDVEHSRMSGTLPRRGRRRAGAGDPRPRALQGYRDRAYGRGLHRRLRPFAGDRRQRQVRGGSGTSDGAVNRRARMWATSSGSGGTPCSRR